jgi:hypothetical protein
MSHRVSRRAFLTGVVASAMITLDRTMSLSVVSGVLDDPQLQLGTQLNALFSSAASARAIGDEYVRLYPDEAVVSTLMELTGIVIAGQRGASDELIMRLQERITADFEQDAVVQLHGWVLSRTESRLCALYALV